MRRAMPVLLGALLWTGCSSGPPRAETRRLPALTFRRGFVKVKETTRIAMRASRFPIETLSDAGFVGPLVEDRGFSWRFSVALGRGSGYVSVSPCLEIVRDRSIRPVRGALTNMGHMNLEEQRSTSLRSNPEAYSKDRESMERHSPHAEREARIDRLNARVDGFVKELEKRLAGSAR